MKPIDERPSKQYPFAGWLEEHPQGAFLIAHENDVVSQPLRSYDELDDYFRNDKLPPIVDVVRARHIHENAESLLATIGERKLYAPDSWTS